jgi:alkylhydroperoxidase/carboxymuconolactone decarboxylase family protein YurZ
MSGRWTHGVLIRASVDQPERWAEVVPATTEEILRRLALQDEEIVQDVLAMSVEGRTGAPWMDDQVHALVRLAALVALDAPLVSYQSAVTNALAVGASAREIVGTLIAVAPLVGLPRVATATSSIAGALGYDLDAAFELLEQADGWPGQQ